MSEPLSGGASILATLLRGGTDRQDRRMRHPSAAGIAARKGELAASNLRQASQLDGKNVCKGCTGLMAPLAWTALDLHDRFPRGAVTGLRLAALSGMLGKPDMTVSRRARRALNLWSMFHQPGRTTQIVDGGWAASLRPIARWESERINAKTQATAE